MGSDSSKIMLASPLVPQSRFPCVVSTRFVLDRVLTLRIPDGFWLQRGVQAFEIRDVDTKAAMFKIPPTKFANGNSVEKLLLLDHNDVPIVSMEGYAVGLECATYVPMIPGPANIMPALENAALCYLETNNRPLEDRLLLVLDDPTTGGVLNIRVDSAWRTHETMFWLDRGEKHNRECIARVRQVKKQSRFRDSILPTYLLDIASGVDVALVVLACAALDQEMEKRTSGQPAEVGTDEITATLAQRHHGCGITRDGLGAKSTKVLLVSTDL